MINRRVVQPFNPIYDKDSKILILGSFPSEISRRNRFYYTNPNNRFWKVLDTILNESFYDVSTETKIELLKKHNIALFDIVYSCMITGSSDKDIKNVVFADIYAILNNSNVKHIFLNGKTAYKLFLEKYPELKDKCSYLPSTSSANARYRLKDLIKKWEIIKNYLQ